jgi:hypothetical protein
MAGYWEAIFPAEIPDVEEKVLPQLLTTDTLDLECNELRVIRTGQADTAQSTVLHVPSLAAVVTGDLACNRVHMMTAETGEPERAPRLRSERRGSRRVDPAHHLRRQDEASAVAIDRGDRIVGRVRRTG